MTIQKGLIGRQDFNLWNGNSEKTFSRKTSTGGIVTLSKVNHFVDVYALYGACTDREITKALSWVGSNNCVFLLSPAIWDIANDLSIPSNVVLETPFGTTLSISSGKTLSMVKPPVAGSYQIFTGSGTATITYYPQNRAWWGETQRDDFSDIATENITATEATITTLIINSIDGGEIVDSLLNIYDEADEIIHQFHIDHIPYLSEVTNWLRINPEIYNTYLDVIEQREFKNNLVSYYDCNDVAIHQISSNEILSLNETFSFA